VEIVNDPDVKLLVFVVLIAGLAGAFWYFQDDILPLTEAPVVAQTEAVSEATPIRDGPAHPMASVREPALSDRKLVPLPSLDDSDSYFLLALVDIFGADVEQMLVNEALIDNVVATVDNLTRSHVAEKIRPVGRLSVPFVADAMGNDGIYALSPDSYGRYDLLVNLVARADLEFITETYRRFYPLFQESYQRLGYPDGYFNDRVVEVIDHLLATPEPTKPIRLVRPHVLYEFADAELEALSSGQKLLLRMGGEHAAEIKRVLQEFRGLIE
jgi:DUF3014 family protein